MQSIPFRLFVVNELDLQDPHRSKQYIGHPLGVVDEYECQPLWKSKAGATYPQELGLILLSGPRTAIKSLRLSVDCTRAPSQIAIFTDTPMHQEGGNGRRSLDVVSRYFSTEWKPCCKPLVWETCSSATLNTIDGIDRVVSLDMRECSLLKLVIHSPHENPRNQFHQVVLENIELLGSTEDSYLSRAVHGGNNSTKCVFGHIHRPEALPPAYGNEELQAVLLDGGVSIDLVAQLTSAPDAKALALSLEDCKSQVADNSGVVPESSSAAKGPAVPPAIAAADVLETTDDEDGELLSPFDSLLRHYVEQTARERAMLEDILATKLCERKDDVSTWQTPTISPTDPANTVEITLYTFGAFFTQCLLCGESDIQVMCVQIAERSAPLMIQIIGPTSVFEGLVALIVLAIREANSPQVFQVAVHLAHSVFLTKVGYSKNEPRQLAPEGFAASANTAALGLIEDISHANWSYGLRIILEWSLASTFCWSISTQGGRIASQPTNSCRHKASLRSVNAPPSIDRSFLQFVRLLIKQDLSRASFFDELHALEPADTAAGSIIATNRLRLFLLVLRNEIIRCQLSIYVRNSIQSLCSKYVASTSTTGGLSCGVNSDLSRLATECLDEISRRNSGIPQTATSKVYTKSVRKHIEDSNNPSNHHTHCYRHTPLFIQDPVPNVEAATFAIHLQRYFVSQPRPNALYRHSFVRANEILQVVPDVNAENSVESFRKGNIAFEGQVIARTPPHETFHDKIQRNTAPFVFNIDTSIPKELPTTHSSQPADKQQIVASFATFRGIIEKRSDPPKRSSKVSPAENVQTTSTAPTPRTTSKTTAAPSVKIEEPATSSAARIPLTNNVPAGADIVMSPGQGMNSPPDSTPAHQMLPSSSQHDKQPAEVAATVEQAKAKPDDKKQLNNSKPPDRAKKGATKGKGKSKGKQDAKDPDNCVLQ